MFLERRQGGPEVAALEDDRDVAAAIRGELGFVEQPERAPARPHLAGGRHVEARGELQHGALPRAGRAEDGDELTGLDPQVQPAQRDRLGRAGAVDLEDVVKLERAPADLGALFLRLAVEALYFHLKLSIINR